MSTFRTSLLSILALPCLLQAQTFTNVTTELLNEAKPPTRPFWVGVPDLNNDGCLDIFLGNHVDTTPSSVWMQQREAGNCIGAWVQMTNPGINRQSGTGGWSQATPEIPRITSRYQFGVWDNNARGMPCFLGADIDGSGGSAMYCPADSFAQGGMQPIYKIKTVGCSGVQMMCQPADIDGDGRLEVVSSSRVSPYGSGFIRRLTSGEVVYRVDNTALAEQLITVDIDGDALPEVLAPGLRGYWQHRDGAQVWVPDRFVGEVPAAGLVSANHCAVLDYDIDGDMDLYCGVGTYYRPTANTFTSYFWNNDNGTFVNVTAEVGITGLRNTAYHTTYANTIAGDLDNNGYPDLLFFGESWGHSAAQTTVPLLMNTNGRFTVTRRQNFGPFTGPTTNSAKGWGAVADMDNDGLLDVIKTHGETSPGWEGVAVYKNTTVTDNRWLRVRVRSKTYDGLHTNLQVLDANGEEIITSGQIGVFTTGYASMLAHLGVGDHEAVTLVVVRPGERLVFENVPTNQQILIDADGAISFSQADKATVED